MGTKKKAATKRPTKTKTAGAKELAALLGVQLAPPLKANQIQRLRKPLPGYVGMLDDAAAQLEEDQDQLRLKDVTPQALADLHARVQAQMAKEAVAEAVYTSVYHQRMQLDDEGMAMLQKVARRIQALKEDDSELPARWKFLLDFLGGFRGGGRQAPGGGDPPA